MKNNYIIISATLTVLFFVSIALYPTTTNCQKKTKTLTNIEIPDSVMSIFKRSCIVCHSTGGNKIASSILNITEWNKYKPKKQFDKAQDICSEVSDGSMPKKSMTKSNPKVILTMQ